MLPVNMLPVAVNLFLIATKLLPVCCPSVAEYKGIQVEMNSNVAEIQATCCTYEQHVAGNKQHVVGQHVALV